MAVAAVLLAACVVIRPASLTADDGLSYFGVSLSTVLPYAAAYFWQSACYWRVSRAVARGSRANIGLALSLQAMAVLIAALVVAPTSLVGFLHDTLGTVLFCLQLALSIWWVLRTDAAWQGRTLLAIEFLAGVVALYYLQRHLGLLLEAQVVFQLAFGLLLIRRLDGLFSDPRPVIDAEVSGPLPLPDTRPHPGPCPPSPPT
ncbi:MAG TPA: hypothetical protein VHT30_09515 [Acidimicrobiales bacterium]|jgi:hypothetical protein|nr:hypothetical protein [Acidimicrobiales bacterium]